MELPTYTSIWRIEKRLYKLYDFRLPMPLPVGQIAVFTAITVPYVVLLTVFGLPFNHNLFWLYVLPPGLLTWLATRPVLESKRLPELLTSQARYIGEPKTWCRMAPLAEQEDVLIVGRVWRRAPGAGGEVAEPAAGLRPVTARPVQPVTGQVRRPIAAASAQRAALAQRAAAAQQGAAVQRGAAQRGRRPPELPRSRRARPEAAPGTPVTDPRARDTAAAVGYPAIAPDAGPAPVPARGAAGPVGYPETGRYPEAVGYPEVAVGYPERVADRGPARHAKAADDASPALHHEAARDHERAAPPAVRGTAGPTGYPQPTGYPRPAGYPQPTGYPRAAGYPAAEGGEPAAYRTEREPVPTGYPEPTRDPGPAQRPQPADPASPARRPDAAGPAEVTRDQGPARQPQAAGSSPAEPPQAAGPATPAPRPQEAVTPRSDAVRRPQAGDASSPAGRPGAADPVAPAKVSPAARAAGVAGRPEVAPDTGPARRDPELAGELPGQRAAGGPGPSQRAAAASADPAVQQPAAGPDSPAAGPAAPAEPTARPPRPVPPVRLVPAQRSVAGPSPARPAPPRQAPEVERVLGGPGEQRGTGWRSHVTVVPGGRGPGRPDHEKEARARAVLALDGPRLVVVLGCTVGAGQTVTTLVLADLLAGLRGEPVAALDLNPGPASLAELARMPATTVSALVARPPGAHVAHAGPAGQAGNAASVMHRGGSRARGRLDVICQDAAAGGQGDAAADGMAAPASLQHSRMLDILASRYPLTLADPGASAVARVLAAADQLVLVAPASGDAAQAVSMTCEWLGGHGHSALAAHSIAMINGVSSRSVHARRAGRAGAARPVPGDRPGALGRPPGRAPGRAGHPGQPAKPRAGRPGCERLHPAVLQAYTALAGVLVECAGGRPGAAEGGTLSARTRRRSRMSVRYFDDRILLTETHAWAYYRLPTQAYEFTHPAVSGRRWRPTSRSRWPRSGCRTPRCTCGSRTAPTRRRSGRHGWTRPPTAARAGGTTWTRCTGTCGRRTSGPRRSTWASGWASGACGPSCPAGCSPSSSTPTGPASRRWASTTRRCPAAEINRWTDQAERLGRALGASALAARHATSDEIAWLFRHTLAGHAGRAAAVGGAPPQAGARARSRRCCEGQVHNGRTMLQPGAPGRGVVRGVPVLLPVPRRDVVPGRRAVAALRRLAAVPGGDQLADAADPAGQGQQGRRAQAGARPGHGRAHPGGRGRRCRSRWPSRSRRPGCWSTASPRSGCRSSTAGTG